MNNLKPYIIFAIIGFTIVIGLLVWGIKTSKVSEVSPESQTELKLGTLFIEGGSAVKGVAIPSWFNPQTYAVMEAIIQCESSGEHEGKWGDIEKKYPAYGIAQFQERTFYWLSEKAGTKGNWKNKYDQIDLLEWAIDNGYSYLWTCAKILGI